MTFVFENEKLAIENLAKAMKEKLNSEDINLVVSTQAEGVFIPTSKDNAYEITFKFDPDVFDMDIEYSPGEKGYMIAFLLLPNIRDISEIDSLEMSG